MYSDTGILRWFPLCVHRVMIRRFEQVKHETADAAELLGLSDFVNRIAFEMNPDGQEEGNQKNEGKTSIQQQRYLEAASADYGRAASCVAYGYGRHDHGQQCRIGRDLSRIFGGFDQ